MKHILLLTFFLLSGSTLFAFGQKDFARRESELRTAIQRVAQVCNGDTLRIAAQHVTNDCDTALRMALNRSFAALLEETLRQDSAFLYPFDSIPYLYRAASPNGLVRTFTWNVPLPDGNRYFGFVLTRKTKADVAATLTTLHDKRLPTRLVEGKELGAHEWFGALYTTVVERTLPYSKATAYTLIGISPTGGEAQSSKKVVEVLNVKPNGECTFGAPIFARKGKLSYRIIFEYNAQAIMELRYVEKTKMIVFSNLVPMYPQLRGRYERYIPSESYDGLIFKQGKWLLEEAVRPPSTIRLRKRGKVDKETGRWVR
ncbi:MAG: hypothetical protein LBU92_04890 [Prevotellaceae bacterium]|nr:hypothetical protein [Prevotellaceae bacterium]